MTRLGEDLHKRFSFSVELDVSGLLGQRVQAVKLLWRAYKARRGE